MKIIFYIFMILIAFSSSAKAENICRKQLSPLFIFSSNGDSISLVQNCFDSVKLREDLSIIDNYLWYILIGWFQGIFPQWLSELNQSNAVKVNYSSDEIIWVRYQQGYLAALNAKTQQPIFSMMVKEESLAQGDFDAIQSTDNLCNINPAFSVWHHERIFLYGAWHSNSSSYYSWDITDFNIKENKFNPVMKFSILGGGSALPDSPYAKMGVIQSAPSLGQVSIDGVVHQVLFFGGGYDPIYKNITRKPTMTNPAKGSQLYMVDANTGDLLWSASHKNSGAKTSHSKMFHSISSRIKVIDSNNDGLTDLIYFGDLGGQIFQVKINNSSRDSFARITLIAETSSSVTVGKVDGLSEASADNLLSVFAQCVVGNSFSKLYLIDLSKKEVKEILYKSGDKIKVPLNSVLVAPGKQVVFGGRYEDFNFSSSVGAGSVGDLSGSSIKTTYWRRVGS